MNQGRGYVWPFGKETWCNLEGRYLHLVADLSKEVTENPIPWDQMISICQLGVFGTKYSRTNEPPEHIEVVRGQTETI